MICEGCAWDVKGFVGDGILLDLFIILSRTCDSYAHLLYFIGFRSFPLSIPRYSLALQVLLYLLFENVAVSVRVGSLVIVIHRIYFLLTLLLLGCLLLGS